jgi:hypothetical protein
MSLPWKVNYETGQVHKKVEFKHFITVTIVAYLESVQSNQIFTPRFSNTTERECLQSTLQI